MVTEKLDAGSINHEFDIVFSFTLNLEYHLA